MNYGIVILAAGNSSRLGQPKQSITFRGKTLLDHTIDEAMMATGERVLVVSGAHEPFTLPVQVVNNAYWQEGMSSSIYIGLITLIKLFPLLEGVIISVCDQPYISAELFKRMIGKQRQTKKGIVAASYKNAVGVPVLFSHHYFYELLNLNGQEGAKTLLNKYPDDMATIIFINGEIDIDTPADHQQLTKEQ